MPSALLGPTDENVGVGGIRIRGDGLLAPLGSLRGPTAVELDLGQCHGDVGRAGIRGKGFGASGEDVLVVFAADGLLTPTLHIGVGCHRRSSGQWFLFGDWLRWLGKSSRCGRWLLGRSRGRLRSSGSNDGRRWRWHGRSDGFGRCGRRESGCRLGLHGDRGCRRIHRRRLRRRHGRRRIRGHWLGRRHSGRRRSWLGRRGWRDGGRGCWLLHGLCDGHLGRGTRMGAAAPQGQTSDDRDARAADAYAHHELPGWRKLLVLGQLVKIVEALDLDREATALVIALLEKLGLESVELVLRCDRDDLATLAR